MSLVIRLNLPREHFTLTVNTTISTQGVTAIFGPSGSGKTSLLRWLAGLETSQGKNDVLSFDGDIWQQGAHIIPVHRRRIGYVFQEPRLFPHLSVLDNLEYSFKRRTNKQVTRPNIEQVCQWLALSALLNQMPETLSGGQQQRVAIGRALLSHPQLLLMDEPLAALDQQSREEILGYLKNWQQENTIPVLYVSHNREEISRLADDLLIIEQGQVIAQGNLQALSHRPDIAINEDDSAGAIIDATLDKHDAEYGLSELLIDEQHRLFIRQMPLSAIGSAIRLRIPARDVSISLAHHPDNSILNILPCVINVINPNVNGQVLIQLKLGSQYLLARLTQKSIERLQLQPGQRVHAQIKSVALLNAPNNSDNS